jgi:hypothetical protein
MSMQQPSLTTPLLKGDETKVANPKTATALDAKTPDIGLILRTLATDLAKVTDETKDSKFPSEILRTKVAANLKDKLQETKISTPQEAKDLLWPYLQTTQVITFMASHEAGCLCYLCSCCWGHCTCPCGCVSNPMLKCTLFPSSHPCYVEIPPPIRQAIVKEHKIVTEKELLKIRSEDRKENYDLQYEDLIEKDKFHTLLKDTIKKVDPDDAITEPANVPKKPFCTSCICCD